MPITRGIATGARALVLLPVLAACGEPPPAPPPPPRPAPAPVRPAPPPLAVPPGADSAGPALWGWVRDTKRNPVAGAEVFVSSSAVARTLEDGSWYLDGIQRGNYRLWARAPGFRPYTFPKVGVGSGLTGPFLVSLEGGLTFRGTVVDEKGDGVPGGTVSVSAPERSSGGTAGTDALGKFEIRGLAAAVHEVRVAARGYLRVPPQRVHPGKENPWRAVLAAGGAVEGVVLSLEGRPVPGARVVANRDPVGGMDDETAADGEGKFRVVGLPAGEARLLAEARGVVFPDFRVATGATGVELRAVPPASLAGSVFGPSGSPVEGARVFVAASGDERTPSARPDAGDPRRWRCTSTDAAGRFLVEDLWGTLFDVEVRAPLLPAEVLRGVPRDSKGLILRPADDSHLAITGTISAPGGTLPARLLVQATGPTGTVKGTLDAAGRFEIPGLRWDAYTVSAEAPDAGRAEVAGVAAGTAGLRLSLAPR